MKTHLPTTPSEVELDQQLVSGPELIQILWTPQSRPSVRWLREATKAKLIPSYRLGERMSFYSVPQVRLALESKLKVEAR